VIKALSENTVLVHIRGTEGDAAELVRRFKQSPKPMYYRPPFLAEKWDEFKRLNGVSDDAAVDPDAFGAWGFEALLHDRLPRYQALADRHGYTVEAKDIANLTSGADFLKVVAAAIGKRMR